jgi:SAM-dependent methyltransferase
VSQYVTEWGRKAANLYATDSARRYRQHAGELGHVEAYLAFCGWLRDVCGRFRRPIDVLDLGCGTGRYFAALRHVNALVGLDASGPMLAEAANPVGADQIIAKTIRLVEGDALTQQFPPGSFDLVTRLASSPNTRPSTRASSTTSRPGCPAGGLRYDRASRFVVDSENARPHARLPSALAHARNWLRDRLTAGGRCADRRSSSNGWVRGSPLNR